MTTFTTAKCTYLIKQSHLKIATLLRPTFTHVACKMAVKLQTGAHMIYISTFKIYNVKGDFKPDLYIMKEI